MTKMHESRGLPYTLLKIFPYSEKLAALPRQEPEIRPPLHIRVKPGNAQQGFKRFWMQDKDKFFRIDPSRDCPHHCAVHVHNTMVYDYLRADPDHLGFV